MSVLILTMPPSVVHPRNYDHCMLWAHETYKIAGPSFTPKDTSWLRGQLIMRRTFSSVEVRSALTRATPRRRA